MAKQTIGWVAANRVHFEHNPQTGSISLAIAINTDWDPETERDYPSGTPETAPEVGTGGQALARRLQQIIAGPLPLVAWIQREEGKRGGDGKGLSRLAADLLGLSTIPKRAKGLTYKEQSDDWKRHAAELRKLQEYRQGKYQNATGERRERIRRLAGAQEQNPYGPPLSFRQALLHYAIALGVRADWRISEDYQPFTLKHTHPADAPSDAHAMLATGGRTFLQTFIDIFQEGIEVGQSLIIDADDRPGHVYGLQIQARRTTPGAARVAPTVPPKPKGRRRKPGGGRQWVL